MLRRNMKGTPMMSFNPFAQMTKAFEQWQKMTEESIQRATAFYGEVDKLEAKGVERSTVAIDEVSVNFKETLAYGAQLTAEWRKLTLGAIQQASAALAVPASTTKVSS
jgi:hypothetical protein